METTYSQEEKEFLIKIGNQIKSLRNKTNLSQEKLSFACNLDRTYIGSVERGERNISIINLRKIAQGLNLNISDLFNI